MTAAVEHDHCRHDCGSSFDGSLCCVCDFDEACDDEQARTVIADEPVCTSCGDRPLGCPRCTDSDGDTR